MDCVGEEGRQQAHSRQKSRWEIQFHPAKIYLKCTMLYWLCRLPLIPIMPLEGLRSKARKNPGRTWPFRLSWHFLSYPHFRFLSSFPHRPIIIWHENNTASAARVVTDSNVVSGDEYRYVPPLLCRLPNLSRERTVRFRCPSRGGLYLNGL